MFFSKCCLTSAENAPQTAGAESGPRKSAPCARSSTTSPCNEITPNKTAIARGPRNAADIHFLNDIVKSCCVMWGRGRSRNRQGRTPGGAADGGRNGVTETP